MYVCLKQEFLQLKGAYYSTVFGHFFRRKGGVKVLRKKGKGQLHPLPPPPPNAPPHSTTKYGNKEQLYSYCRLW